MVEPRELAEILGEESSPHSVTLVPDGGSQSEQRQPPAGGGFPVTGLPLRACGSEVPVLYRRNVTVSIRRKSPPATAENTGLTTPRTGTSRAKTTLYISGHPTMEKHTAIYVRVSSQQQDHASQLPDLERWAAAHDGQVLWFKDKFTRQDDGPARHGAAA